MPHDTLIPTMTQEVMARLYSEGWVDCPDLRFPALSQVPLSSLREHILAQLQHHEGWMWKQDLEMSILVFSIRDHEFQVHPRLQAILHQLQQDGWIEQKLMPQTRQRGQRNAIALIALTHPSTTVHPATARNPRLSLEYQG